MPYVIKVGSRYVGTSLLGERTILTNDRANGFHFKTKLEAARHVRKLYIRRLITKSQNARIVYSPVRKGRYNLLGEEMFGEY